jgi:hypothetical protein
MSDRGDLVDMPPIRPVPDALLIDSSVLGGIPPAGSERRRFINFVRSHDKQLYVSEDVVDELDQPWTGPNGVNDWLAPVRDDTESWITQLSMTEYGVRIRDNPTASEMVDEAHMKLAEEEQEREDELPKTDAKFAGNLVQVLVAEGSDSVGLVIDDRNAEQVLSDVIGGTDYESSVRIQRGPELLDET